MIKKVIISIYLINDYKLVRNDEKIYPLISLVLVEKTDGEHKKWFLNREFTDFYKFISK